MNRRERRQSVLDLARLDAASTTLPRHLFDSRSGRPLPPVDLEPGLHSLCVGCSLAPLASRCPTCPRTTAVLYRRLNEPRERRALRRFLRRREP